MKTNTKIIWGIIILLIAGVIISHTYKSDITKTETIKIGMISILSGDYATVGENIRNGAILAMEQYNAAHPNQKVELVVEDDGFNPKKALSAYQKLTSIDHVDGLFNVSTASIGAIYDLVSKTDIPVIQGGEQTNEPSKDNVFQILPGNIELENQLGAFIKEKGFKNPVVVYTNNDAMSRFKNSMVKGFGSPMKEFVINGDEKDFKPHVLKVSAENPDVIIVLMFPESGAQFLKQYVNLKGKLPQIAFDANAQSGIKDYQRILNSDTLLNNSIIATVSSNTTQEFKDAYKARFGVDAGFWCDLGYDGFNLLLKTYDTDGKKWITNVHDAKLVGASGRIEFDDVGVRKPEVTITKILDGKIQ